MHPEDGAFVIFGGRESGDAHTCRNDVWALSLHDEGSTGRWQEIQTSGEGPPPKVWYGATATSDGNWLIYGGSQWQFEDDGNLDRGVVWVLGLRDWSWSSIR